MGVFVAVANGGGGTSARIMTSPDGINWTIRTYALSYGIASFTSVKYGNGIWSIVSNNITPHEIVHSVDDGITWAVTPAPAANDWASLAFGDGIFVAVGYRSVTAQVMKSTDGMNYSLKNSASIRNWFGITFGLVGGSGLFVAVAASGDINRVMTSPDGEVWTSRAAASINNWLTVCWGEPGGSGLFVAMAYSGTGDRVMTSPDGVTWTARTCPDLFYRKVIWAKDQFVAVAESGTGQRAVTSPDGITWTLQNTPADLLYHGLAYGNGLLVAVAYSGVGQRVMTSNDGEVWTLQNTPSDITWVDVEGNLPLEEPPEEPPDSFPFALATYQGNPFTCTLGKKTSWFLEEFEDDTIPIHWALKAGTYHSEQGYFTLPDNVASTSKLEIGWTGKVLNFAPTDHLSIEVRGRVDAINPGDVSNIYDAFGIKIFLPDLLNWVMIKVRRDTDNPSLYKILTSEYFGSDQLFPLAPAFTSYPLEVTLRIDLYADSISYFVNDIEINSENIPIGLTPVAYGIPQLFTNQDTLHRGYIYYFYVSGSPGFPDLCEGDHTSRITQYSNMLINLLPLGFPWRNLNQIFRLFLSGIASEMDRLHGRSDDLLTQSNPGTATTSDLLTDWERIALLLEELPIGGETGAERQSLVAAKVTTNYSGQSRQFFIDLASRLGLIITISEGGYRIAARVGIARVGNARVNGEVNIFIWNIQFLIDAFDGATVYWIYDGDEDFITYPGYIAALPSATSTFLTFQGGPNFPALPHTINVVYPLKISLSIRCLFSGVTNRTFMLNSWSDDPGLSGDNLFFGLIAVAAAGTYQFDMFGTRNGSSYAEVLDTGIPLASDITFDFLFTITPTGFTAEIPAYGISFSDTGFIWSTLEYIDFSAQRASVDNQGMFAALGMYTGDPSTPFGKFQIMVERLKPAHTQVTYNLGG